ncbi:hypothetical protein [Pseudosporangium ferrugineum]|uniref:Uncharacterized protein n=1 Tax=Pseudosporangium ferrugineum TaxID=439699 RepID=A0A2T0RSF3_9ACTN|nr:hypothetical protein [Pseudosporangium ferrugineum]PRY24040.1 hypothetical protein CLV70_114173 [Pseudosporangium ferrugineum]
MTDLLSVPAVTCPPYCFRSHNEPAGETVIHETNPIQIEQAPNCGKPVDLRVSQIEDELIPLLHVGDDTFDLAGARQLLASVSALVAVMEGASR